MKMWVLLVQWSLPHCQAGAVPLVPLWLVLL
jgi:hypothetical protein